MTKEKVRQSNLVDLNGADELQQNGSKNKDRMSQLDESGKSSPSSPRILFEAHPLTLKNGTGIHVYAMNLLRGIDAERDNSRAGLLLLLDETLNIPLSLDSSSDELKNIKKYAKLLSQLFKARYPNISRSNRNKSNTNTQNRDRSPNVNMSNPWDDWKDIGHNIIRKASDTITLPLSLIFPVKSISFPTVLKPSLNEILNNNHIGYDFLLRHQPYLINLPRRSLILRDILGFSNQINSAEIAKEYNIFHCTHISPLTIKNIPKVTTIHDIVPLIRPELVSSQLVLVFADLLRSNLRNSTKLIAVSQATKDDLVRYCQVPAEKITVVYEAARPEFQPVSADIAEPFLRKIGLITDTVKSPYFIFVGNIEPKKNVKRLLLAFQQFSMYDKRGCKLLIVGSAAWGFDDVKGLMSEMIEDGILIHPGYLPTEQLPALFSHAQALMLPSLIEGFGLPVLEAMACGCPVITSDIPCIREITGDAAIRVNPTSIKEMYEAIKMVANDESLRANLSQLGLAQNQLFSWERCARETLAVYQDAISAFATNRI
jgi:glycosyltransferase involved in cell wall biosynthesis